MRQIEEEFSDGGHAINESKTSHVIHIASEQITLDLFVLPLSRQMEQWGYVFEHVWGGTSLRDCETRFPARLELPRGPLVFLGWLLNIRSVKLLLAKRPDVVHLHTPATAIALLPFLRSFRRRKIHLVYTARGDLQEGVSAPVRLAWRLLDPLRWSVWSSVAVVNRSLLVQARRNRRNVRVYLVPHGGAMPNAVEAGPARKNSSGNQSPDSIKLAWVGRLTPDKKPADFVKLVGTLRSEHGINATGVMVGSGPLAKALSEMPEIRHVEMVGWTEYPGLYTKDCDLMVSTSVREGYGMVILEAGLGGTPSVSRSTRGTVESASDTGGKVVAGADIREIANEILTWFSLPKQEKVLLRQRVSDQSSKTVADGKLAETMHLVYQELGS